MPVAGYTHSSKKGAKGGARFFRWQRGRTITYRYAKGAFILSSDGAQKSWKVSGPHNAGSEVFHLTYDSREGGVLFAAVNHLIWGPNIQRSYDLGKSWLPTDEPPRISGDETNANKNTIKNIWHVEPGRESEDGELYAGVDPAALFRTMDAGPPGRKWLACPTIPLGSSGSPAWVACAAAV